ncbi:MAG: hypothetical protein KDA21_14060 [Phycisphaerales bacterium]|nr:hypothetical protein [Phycisphaerales bacterium]
MRSRISPHDQAKLGAAAGGILLLWVAGAALLILVPLGIASLIGGGTLLGSGLIVAGVAIFGFVLVRHLRIVHRSQSVEDFFPDR